MGEGARVRIGDAWCADHRRRCKKELRRRCHWIDRTSLQRDFACGHQGCRSYRAGGVLELDGASADRICRGGTVRHVEVSAGLDFEGRTAPCECENTGIVEYFDNRDGLGGYTHLRQEHRCEHRAECLLQISPDTIADGRIAIGVNYRRRAAIIAVPYRSLAGRRRQISSDISSAGDDFVGGGERRGIGSRLVAQFEREPHPGFRTESAKTDEDGKRNSHDCCAGAARITKNSRDSAEPRRHGVNDNSCHPFLPSMSMIRRANGVPITSSKDGRMNAISGNVRSTGRRAPRSSKRARRSARISEASIRSDPASGVPNLMDWLSAATMPLRLAIPARLARFSSASPRTTQTRISAAVAANSAAASRLEERRTRLTCSIA